MKPQPWHLAVVQTDVCIGQPELNFTRIEQQLMQAVAGTPGHAATPKPDLIILPEMWNTGYALTELEQLADPFGERTLSMMSTFAAKHQVNVLAGSVAVRTTAGQFANRSYVFDRTGACVKQYDKLHLFRLMDEEQFLQQGTQTGDFQLDGIKAGLMICYDIRFPELARALALNGAKVLYVPAQWPKPRLHHWRTLLQARAIENQMYVVACNRVGTSGTTDFFGHSMVIDPWGEVLAEGAEDEAVLRVTLDLNLVDDVRKRIPVFADRRPELY